MNKTSLTIRLALFAFCLSAAGTLIVAAPSASEVTVERVVAPVATPVMLAAPVTTTAAPTTTVAPTTTSTTRKPRPTTSTTVAHDYPTPLQVAEGEVGKAGSYSASGFWCASFVSWAADQAGLTFKGSDSPAALAADAQADGSWHSTPRIGDLIFVNLAPEYSTADQVSHVGIVASIEGGNVTSIERNPGEGDDVVVRHVRALTDAGVVGFASFE